MSQQEPKLNVIARAPFHIYYEGPALAVMATNEVGDFSVLPGHADLFSVMSPGEVAIQINEDIEPVVFKISHGIITVRNDEVMIFVNM